MDNEELESRLNPRIVIPVFFLTTGGVTSLAAGIIIFPEHNWFLGLVLLIAGIVAVFIALIYGVVYYVTSKRDRKKIKVDIPRRTSVTIKQSDTSTLPVSRNNSDMSQIPTGFESASSFNR